MGRRFSAAKDLCYSLHVQDIMQANFPPYVGLQHTSREQKEHGCPRFPHEGLSSKKQHEVVFVGNIVGVDPALVLGQYWRRWVG